MDVKRAEFAGSWYPSSAIECEQKIKEYLESPLLESLAAKEYFAGISPHAGWYFSGSIACNVIRLLRRGVSPDLIIVFGKHMHRTESPSILIKASCETPFGNIETDDDFAEKIFKRVPLVKETADSFNPENTIELQLPFVKYFFEDVKLAVIGVPPGAAAVNIGEAAVDICMSDRKNVKIIGSTDMTHYGNNFGFTPAGVGKKAADWVRNHNDKKMIDAMLTMDTQKILTEADENQNACCSGAVAATVSAANALGIGRGEKVAYSTSYEQSPGESFVGYAGIVY